MQDFNEKLTAANYFTAKTDAQRIVCTKLLSYQTLENVPLLLGVKLRPFESVESLIFHAAERNGLRGISALSSALRLPEREIFNPKRHAQLSKSFNAELDELAMAIPTYSSKRGLKGVIEFGGHYLERDQLAISTTRLCPLCLRDHGYGRSYWMLSPFSVCEEHGTQLIDCCPTCDSPISLARPAYAVCSCGANFADCHPPKASISAHYLGQLLASRFKNEKTGITREDFGFPNKPLKSIPLQSLLDLIAFFGSMHSNQKIVRMRKLSGAMSLRVALVTLERAARALNDWPNGFYAELRKSRAYYPRSESLAHVAKSIDHVLNLAIMYMSLDDRRFVTDEIGHFLAKPQEWNEARRLHAMKTGMS